LEPAILELSPQLEGLKKRLKLLNTQGVMISGSGPAVFGLTSSPKVAKDLQKILKRRHTQVFAVRTL
jgi:4-diphosphocytidyl-2-C-methyl-D-erythritol kinase